MVIKVLALALLADLTASRQEHFLNFLRRPCTAVVVVALPALQAQRPFMAVAAAADLRPEPVAFRLLAATAALLEPRPEALAFNPVAAADQRQAPLAQAALAARS